MPNDENFRKSRETTMKSRLMLAWYAVRRLIHKAAGKASEDADRISFFHAVHFMRRRIINPGLPPGGPDGRGD